MRITKKSLLSLAFCLIFSLLLVIPLLPAKADSSLIDSQTGISAISNVYGKGTPTDIRATIAIIINIVLSLLGIIFVVLTLFAGFKYMTAAGNEEKTKEALALLRNAVIGLIIILMAWGITRFSIWMLNRAVKNASMFYSAR